MAYKEADTYMN